MSNKEDWVKLEWVNDWYSHFTLGGKNLIEVVKDCSIFDVKIGNKIFESCVVSVYRHEYHGAKDDSSSDEAMATTLDGIQIKLDGAFLRKKRQLHDIAVRKRKEEERQEKVNSLILLKNRVEKILKDLQSSDVKRWDIKIPEHYLWDE